MTTLPAFPQGECAFLPFLFLVKIGDLQVSRTDCTAVQSAFLKGALKGCFILQVKFTFCYFYFLLKRPEHLGENTLNFLFYVLQCKDLVSVSV